MSCFFCGQEDREMGRLRRRIEDLEHRLAEVECESFIYVTTDPHPTPPYYTNVRLNAVVEQILKHLNLKATPSRPGLTGADSGPDNHIYTREDVGK